MTDELDHIFGDDPDLVDEDAPDTPGRADLGESFPGGTAELVALAAHDANDLLRFVESAMTEAESNAFIAAVRERDPESAARLLQMREDQRLLRTSVDLEVPPDLLGPVRARIARGELVQVQSDIAMESADPTAFMSRSVATLARRRRRARRRPIALAAIFGIFGLLTGLFVAGRIGLLAPSRASDPAAASPSAAQEGRTAGALASFGLVVPAADLDRVESAIAVVAVRYGAVFLRNEASGPGAPQPRPIVGVASEAPSVEIRADLGRRGFTYALVVDRGQVSTVLAEVGLLADVGPEGRTTARLIPSSRDATDVSVDEDAWTNWSHRAEATEGIPVEATRLVVPIALTTPAE